MKNLLLLLTLAALLAACQPQENLGPQALDRSASRDEVATALVEAQGLRVAEFREDGRNKTREFEGYRFTFHDDGRVVATSSDETVEGTYRVFRDDGRTELSMDFPSVGEFYELTDDWYFRSQSDGRLRFEDFLGVLVFENI